MTPLHDIVDVSETDFQYEVIEYSITVPVIVDFWAEWCLPCKTLGPLLEGFAREASGRFRLAKVNVDENPGLSRRYKVRTLPMIQGFRDGQVISEIVGVFSEMRLHEFVREISSKQDDLNLEKGRNLLQMGQIVMAEKAYRSFLEENPGHSAGLLGLSKCLILQGKTREAHFILDGFPASKEFKAAETLLPVAEAMNQIEETGGDDPLDAAFFRALRLVGRGNLPAAMDGMLDILRQNKHYREGSAHRIMLGLLELAGEENTLTRQYRTELASILF